MSTPAPPLTSPSVPTDIVFQVLLCCLRYKLSFRDISEFFLLRRFEFTHETVRGWEERFAPIFAQQLRAKRQGKIGRIWHVDETYIRIKGGWCYLYRDIDEDGNLVEVRLSEKRDMEAAKAFFAGAHEVTQQSPKRVETDGHTCYPRAIAEELGEEVEHKVISCRGIQLSKAIEGLSNATI